MNIGNLIEDVNDWLAALPADFAFLLALPFAVAIAGLLRCMGERERTPGAQARERRRMHRDPQRLSRVH